MPVDQLDVMNALGRPIAAAQFILAYRTVYWWDRQGVWLYASAARLQYDPLKQRSASFFYEQAIRSLRSAYYPLMTPGNIMIRCSQWALGVDVDYYLSQSEALR